MYLQHTCKALKVQFSGSFRKTHRASSEPQDITCRETLYSLGLQLSAAFVRAY